VKGKLAPPHRRSKLGPTRYVARCVSRVRVAKRPCWNVLPAGEHTGICADCRDIMAKALARQWQIYDEA
jgi:hypothetical protein